MSITPVVRLTNVRRTFPVAGRKDDPRDWVGLRSASLRVDAGERVVIVGSSGSGKSTLMNVLGLLDRPDAGEYELGGEDVLATVAGRHDDVLRRETIGFVFQEFHILGDRTPYENLELRLVAARTRRRERAPLIDHWLSEVGLAKATHGPSLTLSGGEKQRLAIARALMTEPALVLADEPTGNLDAKNSQKVLDLLAKAASRGAAVVVITHDPEVARWADRVLMITDGVLSS